MTLCSHVQLVWLGAFRDQFRVPYSAMASAALPPSITIDPEWALEPATFSAAEPSQPAIDRFVHMRQDMEIGELAEQALHMMQRWPLLMLRVREAERAIAVAEALAESQRLAKVKKSHEKRYQQRARRQEGLEIADRVRQELEPLNAA